MATQKPISTISYNSEAFLLEHLEAWRKAHIIQTYMYIFHKGEDGDKDHIHLRIEPNKKLDPMDLAEQLKEYVFGKEKPLGVRPFRPSKEEDWILYAVHDPTYLSHKYQGGEKGEKLPYEWNDIVVPDDYDMEIAYIRAKASMAHSTVNMTTRLLDGVTPMTLILEGENPFMVNALTRSLAENDYQRLFAENQKLQAELNNILAAIDSAGFYVVLGDEGKFSLSRYDT